MARNCSLRCIEVYDIRCVVGAAMRAIERAPLGIIVGAALGHALGILGHAGGDLVGPCLETVLQAVVGMVTRTAPGYAA
eukprot:8809908-Pyramimonas_sp.AAC.1